MPVKKLKEFLDAQNVKYVSIFHSLTYTAQEIAASVHIKGKELAKTVFPPPLCSGGMRQLSSKLLLIPSATLRGEPGVRDRCPLGAAQLPQW